MVKHPQLLGLRLVGWGKIRERAGREGVRVARELLDESPAFATRSPVMLEQGEREEDPEREKSPSLTHIDSIFLSVVESSLKVQRGALHASLVPTSQQQRASGSGEGD